MEKKDYRKITVADMSPHVHSFLPMENKAEKIKNWIANWIDLSLECGKIFPYDLLPAKADLASHIGVSQGTIQNAYRLLEDEEYVESKQRIGTYIKERNNKPKLEKLTSKREFAVEVIKRYILDNSYNVGDVLISIRKLSQLTGISNTTLRTSAVKLVALGVLEKVENNFVIKNLSFEIESVQTKTLVEKVVDKLRKYIIESLKPGDRLPTNIFLTKRFKVSVKTIHDAVRMLAKEGLLYTRRGQYGTIVVDSLSENAQNTMYIYEKFEQKIRQYIIENCQTNDKLPPIKEFAKIFGTSEKTIKKALDNLAEDGYLAFVRGRYGGTFVLEIPQAPGEAYKWLAISTDYISN